MFTYFIYYKIYIFVLNIDTKYIFINIEWKNENVYTYILYMYEKSKTI